MIRSCQKQKREFKIGCRQMIFESLFEGQIYFEKSSESRVLIGFSSFRNSFLSFRNNGLADLSVFRGLIFFLNLTEQEKILLQ